MAPVLERRRGPRQGRPLWRATIVRRPQACIFRGKSLVGRSRMRSRFTRRTALLGAFIAGALALAAPAWAQQKTPIKIAVGGASCLCYLPTVLAKQLGLYEKYGLDAEL